ncbi:MAG: thrombospondin type 3 repeat-containing protein [Candidatus Paceibacterota bacterium]
MSISARTTRIIAASGLALSFMGVSYIISGPTIFGTNSASAESTQELLAAYAAKDTDNDGLPDWQETLYGTDPSKAISNSYGIPDGEAAQKGLLTPTGLKSQLPADQATTTITKADIPGPDAAPGSVTDEFSQQFLQKFFQATGGQQMTPEAQQALLTQLLGDFSTRAGKVLASSYSGVSVHTNPSIDILTYAASVEKIVRAHDVPAGNSQPLPLMEALIEKNDESARPKLIAISSAYRAIANDLMTVSVPPALVPQHVALVQAFDSLAKSTNVITVYEKDPLGTLGAFSTYQDSSALLATTLTKIATIILQGGEPANGTPGSLIVFLGRLSQPK